MKRLKRLESHGYKVSIDMNSGNAFAKKGLRTIKANSITALHKKIFNC